MPSFIGRLVPLLLSQYVFLESAHALPTVNVAAAPPAEYTANPAIGSGSGTYKDSAHFRVYGVDSTTADKTLKIMEAAHGCFVEQLGWRTPGLSYKGSNDGPFYKTNIYKTAADAMPGAAAQTWTDANAGLAFLKVVDKYMTEPGVIVHEFGHAMHYSEKNWIDQTRTGAWWEPIANYIADVYIATPTCKTQKQASNLPDGNSLIELKKVISDSFQVLVDGTSGSGNYYQSWPFISYIQSNPDSFPGLGPTTLIDMIRKYKLNSDETPLHALERNLKAVSGAPSVQSVVGRYWARMAFVDIGHAKAKAMFESQRKSLNYANLDGGNGKWTVKSARAPRYMGANIVPLKLSSGSSKVDVTITGSGGSGAAPSSLTATLVIKGADGSTRYTELSGGRGSVDVKSGEEVMLVVANTPALVLYDPFKISADLNRGVAYGVQITGATV